MRSHNVARIRPFPALGSATRGSASANEVTVFVLDDILVDPPAPQGPCALFGKDQRGQRVLCSAQEPAELAGLIVRIERRELPQVQGAFATDVFDYVEIDLEGGFDCTDFDVMHTTPVNRSARPEKLLD